ncbi:SH3 domain-containing protein [Scytonema hofmannii FACHB-248]|uniref:SH3 domain-containing protein n=1 Tax=Scytonema hofmannii FACHB-248 TaxID=1842502 RepID=A0ABR8GVN2_9CYAN|nr:MULTISPECIES: SH3 domain-containing protein [Nostocales]MBD2607180.1 SH3 domain-containing protein [Scytonema hofmannii FACHB-248]
MKKAIQNIVFSGVNITLLAVIPFMLKAPSANAQSIQSAVVIDPPSNVRVKPNGAIICAIRSQAAIAIYDYKNGWYKTDACGRSGFIHQSQIRLQSNSEVVEAYCSVTGIQTGQLALRFSPNGKSKAGLNNGNTVLPMKTQGNWSYVRVISGPNNRVNGLEGWVNSNYIACP